MKHYIASLLLFFFSGLVSANSYEKVLVAVDHAPPYGMISDDGKVSGAIVDIMREMQPSLPIKFEYVACPFSRCLKMLEQNELDVMGGLIRTEAREQKMQFLTPPYMMLSSSFVFYAKADSELKINNYQDLVGKRIAVMRGAAHFPRFDADKTLTKIEALSEHNAFEMLLKNRVDLVIAVEETADHASVFLQRPSQEIVKMPYRYKDVIYGHIALSKQFASSSLAEKIQERLNTLVLNGRLTELVKSYNLPPVTAVAIDK
ncbi:transporter substrate-binding domain-containing protein [Pseudoalteromonas sp. Cn5-37]|uniref:substrate-binding periplasmic protein n=1 Tax=Pseudoalteromonas sp. Cn5-37 TaxID=2908886 RepID=UPI001F3CE289|nr:transporter substrate-binding domain-containing protein [Pseudoalteromonas sp. Cn5-37]MCF2917050.1 transporter substrate-binding domain-containing protein [Pseudoalteromonas sp. Cn5-37]